MSRKMPVIGIVYSLLLIGLGPLFYSLASQKSMTVFIPTFLGGIAFICAVIALKEKYLKHGMHGVALIALLGTLVGAKSMVIACYGVVVSFFGNKFFLQMLPLADKEKSLLALTSTMMLILAFSSFIEARKSKKNAR